MGTNGCSQPASKSSWDSQDFGDVNMVLKMAHFHKSSRPQWVKHNIASTTKAAYANGTLDYKRKEFQGTKLHYINSRYGSSGTSLNAVKIAKGVWMPIALPYTHIRRITKTTKGIPRFTLVEPFRIKRDE